MYYRKVSSFFLFIHFRLQFEIICAFPSISMNIWRSQNLYIEIRCKRIFWIFESDNLAWELLLPVVLAKEVISPLWGNKFSIFFRKRQYQKTGKSFSKSIRVTPGFPI
jgi:hypothetical protein